MRQTVNCRLDHVVEITPSLIFQKELKFHLYFSRTALYSAWG